MCCHFDFHQILSFLSTKKLRILKLKVPINSYNCNRFLTFDFSQLFIIAQNCLWPLAGLRETLHDPKCFENLNWVPFSSNTKNLKILFLLQGIGGILCFQRQIYLDSNIREQIYKKRKFSYLSIEFAKIVLMAF